MLYGVTINDTYNTLTDWKLYFKAGGYSVGCAEPMTCLVNVPGGDLILNLSNALTGSPVYVKRTITVNLWYLGKRSTWVDMVHVVENALNGQWCTVRFDDSPAYQYEGLVTVTNQPDSNKQGITLTIECDPYATYLAENNDGHYYLSEPITGGDYYGF